MEVPDALEEGEGVGPGPVLMGGLDSEWGTAKGRLFHSVSRQGSMKTVVTQTTGGSVYEHACVYVCAYVHVCLGKLAGLPLGGPPFSSMTQRSHMLLISIFLRNTKPEHSLARKGTDNDEFRTPGSPFKVTHVLGPCSPGVPWATC